MARRSAAASIAAAAFGNAAADAAAMRAAAMRAERAQAASAIEVTITLHTTSEDPWCEITEVATGRTGEFLGDLDAARAFAAAHNFEITEEVWS